MCDVKAPVVAPSSHEGAVMLLRPIKPASPPKSQRIIAKLRRAGLRGLTQPIGRDYRSSLRERTAPSRQIGGVFALGQFYRFFDRPFKVVLDRFALHAPAQKIRPQKFAERRGVLGKAPGAAQLARQRSKRIVDQIRHAFGNVTIVPPLAFTVE